MTTLIAILATLAATGAAPRWSSVELLGWTRDGAALAYAGRIDIADSAANGASDRMLDHHYRFLVVADPAGTVRRIFRDKQVRELDGADDRGEALWRDAEPEEAGRAWLAEHAVVPAPRKVRLREAEPGRSQALPVKLGGVDAGLVRLASRDPCRRARLALSAGAAQAVLLEDGCATRDRSFSAYDDVYVVPSPDGDRAAIGWNAVFHAPAGATEMVARHGYVAVATPRTPWPVDLLDAGAGANAEEVAARLAAAGFSIAHRGKAQKARTESAVYFTEGAEAQAREAARLVGATVIERATWKTPYPITVAAAR